MADRFHVFKLLTHVLDKERKKLRHEFKNDDNYKAIKWLLFKPWESLNDKQKRTLLRAFRKAKMLQQLYFTKNELRNIFESDYSKQQARKIVEQWILQAKSLKHNLLDNFINTLERHFESILYFFTHRVSNGIVEGVNNVIKAIKRNGFGFRNFDNFKLKIQCQFL